jgi:hypothetical protein
MSYFVEIFADDRRSDWQLIDEKKLAEDRYFRALALVTQKLSVSADDGSTTLSTCWLVFVRSTNEANEPRTDARAKKDARRVQGSDDPLCGEAIVVEGLFKIIH